MSTTTQKNSPYALLKTKEIIAILTEIQNMEHMNLKIKLKFQL